MTSISPNNKQIARLARMAAIGELAGGIAHHMRNNLAVVLGNLQLLAEGDEDFLRGKSVQMITDALFAAEKSTDLSQELSELAISDSGVGATSDMNEVVRSFAELARIALGKDTVLNLRLADGELRLPVDRMNMASCLLFLLLNARSAMPSGGSVVITTGASVEGANAVLSVTDTGSGMEPAVLELATELFYTGRDSGEAGGLGLSVIKAIAESVGGDLDIESEPGTGTTASVILPLLS